MVMIGNILLNLIAIFKITALFMSIEQAIGLHNQNTIVLLKLKQCPLFKLFMDHSCQDSIYLINQRVRNSESLSNS